MNNPKAIVYTFFASLLLAQASFAQEDVIDIDPIGDFEPQIDDYFKEFRLNVGGYWPNLKRRFDWIQIQDMVPR